MGSTRIVSLIVTKPLTALAVLGASDLLASSAVAQSFKLNGPLARAVGGGVFDSRFSPDGAWVVYRATQDSPVPGLFSVPVDASGSSRRLVSADGSAIGKFEITPRNLVVYRESSRLFGVPIDGRQAPHVLAPTDPDGNLADFQVSADGARAVFTTYAPGNGLFSVLLDGRADPVRLAGPGIIQNFVIDPGGAEVVFVNHGSELHSVPIDGSAEPVRLNGVNEYVPLYRPPVFAPGGERVLYLAEVGPTFNDELWVVAIDGSAVPVKLNGPLQRLGDVSFFKVSPDGQRVLYNADQEFDHRRELYSVPLDASQPPVKLNGRLRGPNSLANSVDVFEFGSGGHRVVYRADQDSSSRDDELYSVPIDGSATAQELAPRALLNFFSGEDRFALAAGGTRVVYRVSQGGVVDLYSASIGRGEAIRLTDTVDPATGPWFGFQVSPDGRVVIYQELVPDGYEVRRVPVDGSSDPLVLAGPLQPLSSYPPSTVQISPDGQHVLYRADLAVAGVREIFGVPVDGRRELRRLNDPLVTETVIDDVTSFQISADGSLTVFGVRVVREDYAWTELHAVSLKLGARPVKLYPPAPFDEDRSIVRYAISPEGSRLVFMEEIGDSEPDFALRSVPTDGSVAPVVLDLPGGPFQLSPDGAWVLFTTLQSEFAEPAELYAVPVGGGPRIELSSEPLDGEVASFQISPAGSRVFYVAGGLFSVPIDGSSAPVQLDGGLVSRHSPVHVSPDGSRLVYLVDRDGDGRFELASVLTGGGSSSLLLSDPLGSVLGAGLRISPDGMRAVYLAVADDAVELYSVPIDGASPAVRLNAALALGGEVSADFEVSRDSARVVYRADQELDERFELFGVPIDGSASPVKLSGLLGTGGDVQSGFVLSPDANRVIYRADAIVNERIELFSVPLDGGSSPIVLNGALPAGGDVLDGQRITSDGKQALYSADQDADEVFELFAAPLDRTKAARKVSGPLVPGGDAGIRFYVYGAQGIPFETTPDGLGVVYLADQDTDDAFELYLSVLDRPRLSALATGR